MFEKSTILVTGGAGYIGSHTIIELLNAGVGVLSADNFSNSSPSAYERIRKITGKEVRHIEIDLCDAAAVKKLFSDYGKIDGIIHFAAYKSVPESVAAPLMYYRNNMLSLINVLEASHVHKIRSFIFSSSCSVYGNIAQLPVDENTQLGKVESPYAYTKQVGEQLLHDFIRSDELRNPSEGFRAISLRYFNPVGAHESGLIGEEPRNRPNNLVPFITQSAIGKLPPLTVFGNDYDTRDGTCIRDYIHVSDIAAAHVAALRMLIENKTDLAYDVINLGTGNGVTVLEAIAAFEKASGQKLNYTIGPRRAGDVEAIYSDSAKALKVLGWKAGRDIETMMASAWKWEQELAKG